MRHPIHVSLDTIRQARGRIADLAVRTPMIRVALDDRPGDVYLKLENLQPVGSFKIRGAANAVRALEEGARQRGVYTASTGNMGIALAWAARSLGVPCSVIVPERVSPAKAGALASLGASVVTVSFEEWWRVIVAHDSPGLDRTLVHSVADADVIAGHGTVALEILEELPAPDAIVVPFGGGGLATGIATVMRAQSPTTKVFAAEATTAAPLAAALARGEMTTVPYAASFVDGIGSTTVLPEMWPLVSRLLDGSLLATPEDAAAAVRWCVERARVIAEGAAGVALAAALRGAAGAGDVVCVVTGGNIDPTRLADILTARR